jgi:parallel beta-helix repeat protein
MHRFGFPTLLSTATLTWAYVVMPLLTSSLHHPSRASAEENVGPRISRLEAGPNVQYEMQSKLIDAMPGDVIELAEGHFQFHRQLDITTSHLTIRGAGSSKTVLSFKGQAAGGAGLEATGDELVLEGLAVEDTAGNAIKVLGADGVIFRDVRTEWTGGAASTNGAYGIYPVQCTNVLIEKCTAIGASDAGIYVGQSRNVIVRSNRAERNVAGIEIENTVFADVHHNIATKNTGGILVFDLPGLQIKSGSQVRVHHNQITDNNHLNFAAKGNVVASVPPGMGIMVMATDKVEVDHNTIKDHQTTGVAVLAYQATGKRLKKQDTSNFDPYPEQISVHNNQISNSGYAPAGEMGVLLAPFAGGIFPDIFWDGVCDPKQMQEGSLTEKQIPAIHDNGEIRFTNFDLSRMNPRDLLTGRHRMTNDLKRHKIKRPQIPKVVLPPGPPPRKDASTAVLVYRAAKKTLSEYGLFRGDIAAHVPADNVYPYELNTPLFSDYTTKYRFFQLPAGEQIRYTKQGSIQFPVGTVISKTFAYPVNMTDPNQGERLLETRIEFRQKNGWFGFSYLWNKEQTEAMLALGGSEVDVSWIHTDGKRRENRYQVPNANQCLNCHQQGEDFVPIGPVAENLNGNWDHGHGSLNQLNAWTDQGLLIETPSVASIDAWPVFNDAEGRSVSDRARSWLHVNCAHCHNPHGSARTSGLDLRLTQMDPAKFGVHKIPVAAGHGSGGRSFDIVPGKPDDSILLYRIESEDPGIAMPSVGKSLVPVEAAALIRQWIEQLD